MNKIVFAQKALVFIGIFSVVNIDASQTLDVCIRVDKTKALRRTHVDSDNLSRFGRFGIKGDPFDQYFKVIAVDYIDKPDNQDCVEVIRDLVKKAPAILGCTSLSPKERQQYQFPKFVSHSFIQWVEEAQKREQPIIKQVYKKDGNNIFLKYNIEFKESKSNVIENNVCLEAETVPSEYFNTDIISLLFLFLTGR